MKFVEIGMFNIHYSGLVISPNPIPNADIATAKQAVPKSQTSPSYWQLSSILLSLSGKRIVLLLRT